MSQQSTQLTLLDEPDLDQQADWTFAGSPTRELTHCYHDYPARMIPQIANKLLEKFGQTARTLFDPYCGTGTSLVEGLIHGINAIGTDINPLARLIAEAKTTRIDLSVLDQNIRLFNQWALGFVADKNIESLLIAGINRLDFWFKPEVVARLYAVCEFIQGIAGKDNQLFFNVAFSETVRESSNTRNEEFKLYRYDEARLAKFAPNVFGLMAQKLKRNRAGLADYLLRLDHLPNKAIAKIYSFNTVDEIPREAIKSESVDIVITSPPYGDSHTTVAYGQYSRLSSAWLGLHEPASVDRKLMGGSTLKQLTQFDSVALNHALHEIHQQDAKRGREVAAFYTDLRSSICNVANVLKPKSYACYVVGNRKVKGVVIPTDLAVRDFFFACGFNHVDTFIRAIPNKRMPLRNSPTNTVGSQDATMTKEYIVVMQKH